MTKRFFAPILIGSLVGISCGSDKGFSRDPNGHGEAVPEKEVRTVYLYRSAFGIDSTDAVERQFAGQARFNKTNTGTGPGVLITASESTTADVLKLLNQLDRAPKMLEIEVAIVEAPPTKQEGAKEVSASDFAGPVQDVMGRIDALGKSGHVQRIRLTTLENQTATVQYGGSKPILAGMRIAGGRAGSVQQSVNYVDITTKMTVNAAVKADNTITVKVELRDTRLKSSEIRENGDEMPPAVDKAELSVTMNLKSGQAEVAQAVRSDGKAGQSLAVVVVAAKIIDASVAPGK